MPQCFGMWFRVKLVNTPLFLVANVWNNTFTFELNFGLNMSINDELSFGQFLEIKDKLIDISDTWSDLWALIFYTEMSPGRLIYLRHENIRDNVMLLQGVLDSKVLRIELPPPVVAMLNRRREMYPDDIFVFQSRSNRVKKERNPVTLIAFNAALRRVSKSLSGVKVSSNSARKVHRYTHHS